MCHVFAGLGMGGDDLLLAKVIDEAEATGRFRRLVPREDVQNAKPFFLVHDTRPRFRIPKEER